tara:strand:- start:2995 stop:3231 length:237 start_codon:yes stop_codon:yes gene_type:complete
MPAKIKIILAENNRISSWSDHQIGQRLFAALLFELDNNPDLVEQVVKRSMAQTLEFQDADVRDLGKKLLRFANRLSID